MKEKGCSHKYILLSDNRVKLKYRYTSCYVRTLEYFCEKCLNSIIKEEKYDSDDYNRPYWCDSVIDIRYVE